MESKNYVVVEYEKKYEFDKIEDIIKSILGENYYDLSEEEKYKKLKLKTYINAVAKNIPIIEMKDTKQTPNIENEIYILKDEMTFLLSLAKNKDIVIFEKESNKVLAKDIDTTNLRKISEEYIVINDCANQILEKEISKNI